MEPTMQDKSAGKPEEPDLRMPRQEFEATLRRALTAGRLPEDQVPKCVRNSRKGVRQPKK